MESSLLSIISFGPLLDIQMPITLYPKLKTQSEPMRELPQQHWRSSLFFTSWLMYDPRYFILSNLMLMGTDCLLRRSAEGADRELWFNPCSIILSQCIWQEC
jgi:hypothetical protein